MNKLSKQLTLGLSLKDEATFDNFYFGKNAEIKTILQKAARGQGEQIIYLCANGQGISHLLQACCHEATQHQRSSVYLPLAQLLTFPVEILNDLETLSLICIDDLHMAAQSSQWQEAIFHLYNRVHAANGTLILAAHVLPKLIAFTLPDLVSRLSWGMVYQLHALTDTEKLLVLRKRASDRGISLSEEVGKYIMTHCPRHMSTLFAALDTLDKASLAAQRRLTIPFVKEILQI